MLKRQTEIAHSQGKVGECYFCRHETAELWFDPSDDWKPFQVRCGFCGARGPWADCGWESAVPAWDMVGRKENYTPAYRGPERDDAPADSDRRALNPGAETRDER